MPISEKEKKKRQQILEEMKPKVKIDNPKISKFYLWGFVFKQLDTKIR